MHFLKENGRVRIYVTANSLKSAAPCLLRRSLLLVQVVVGKAGRPKVTPPPRRVIVRPLKQLRTPSRTPRPSSRVLSEARTASLRFFRARRLFFKSAFFSFSFSSDDVRLVVGRHDRWAFVKNDYLLFWNGSFRWCVICRN